MTHRKAREMLKSRWQRVFSRSFAHHGGLRPGAPAALALIGLSLAGSAGASDVAIDPFSPADATCLGMAGVGRGSPSSLDNVWYGSAVLALEPRYDIHGSGFLTPQGWKGFGVAALDARTSQLALGLNYTYMHHPDMPLLASELPGWELPGSGADNPTVSHHVAAGLAINESSQRRIGLGLHAGYLWRKAARAGDGGGFRIGGSLAGRPHEALTLNIGATWPLLITGARGFEDQARVDAGARWRPVDGLSLLADAALPLDELDGVDFGLGSEYVIGETVPLRVGWSRNAGEVRNALGAGLGIKSPYLDLQYGIWIDLGPGDDDLDVPTHALTLAMEF
jgi:hypothetical protein